MYVLALSIDLYLDDVRTLKRKRQVLTPVLEGIRRRYRLSAAEVDHHDKWQRARIGIAVVASSVTHAEEVMDEVERFVWSFPEIRVLDARRSWLEQDR